MLSSWRPREPVNTVTHALGVVAGVVLGVLFVARGQTHWTVLVFALSFIALYSASSVYHALDGHERRVRNLKRLDHSAIFLLIAGTYTPVLYFALPEPWRWVAMIVVWGIALVGIALKWSLELPEWLSLTLYVLMGWIAVALLPVLVSALPRAAFVALVIGGVLYTMGVPFFATRRTRAYLRGWGPHEVWHVFVLGGSAAHALMVLMLPLG